MNVNSTKFFTALKIKYVYKRCPDIIIRCKTLKSDCESVRKSNDLTTNDPKVLRRISLLKIMLLT